MTETREGTDVVEPDDVLRTLAEWHTTLRQWSGSAFIAGEDIGDTDGAREQLYGENSTTAAGIHNVAAAIRARAHGGDDGQE